MKASMQKRSLGLMLAVAFGLLSQSLASSAYAQQPGAGGTQPKAQGGAADGYGYSFEDDPLSAGGLAPTDATIKVRPGPVRTTLIRPRTSFVPEMLKSVENL